MHRRTAILCGLSMLSGCSRLNEAETEPTGDPIQGTWAMCRAGIHHDGTPVKAQIPTNVTKQWTVDPDGAVISTPLVINSQIYIITSRNMIHSINPTTGAVNNSFSIENDAIYNGCPAITSKRTVLLTNQQRLSGYNLDQSSLGWDINDFGAKFAGGPSGPTVDTNTAYVGIGGHGGVMAIDCENGEIQWTYSGISAVNEPVSLNGSTLLAVGVEGELHAISQDTGNAIWSVNLKAPSDDSMPAISNDQIFVGDENGTLYRFSTTGEQTWLTNIGQNELRSPAVTADHVFTVDQKGKITVVSRSDGKVIGQQEIRTSTPISKISDPIASGSKVGVLVNDDVFHTYSIDQQKFTQHLSLPVDSMGGETPVLIDGRMITAGDSVVIYTID